MLTALLLVLVVFGYAVPKDFVVTDGIPTFGTAIAGVAFDGVDIAVFDFLNDANMVGEAVLGAAVALVVPVEVDDHAGDRFDGTVHPLSFCLEPIHTDTADCGVGDDACFEVAAFRYGGHTTSVERSVSIYKFDGTLVLISMNSLHIEKIECHDGDTYETDPNRPFALILPSGGFDVYDNEGNLIDLEQDW